MHGHTQVLRGDRRTEGGERREPPSAARVGAGEEVGRLFLTQAREGRCGAGRLTRGRVRGHWAGRFPRPAVPWAVETPIPWREGKGAGSFPVPALGEGGVSREEGRGGGRGDWVSPFPGR